MSMDLWLIYYKYQNKRKEKAFSVYREFNRKGMCICAGTKLMMNGHVCIMLEYKLKKYNNILLIRLIMSFSSHVYSA